MILLQISPRKSKERNEWSCVFEKMQGIILRTQDYGETHKIVTLLTKETGKIGAIARGAKKPKSRMAAITQPFVYGEFLIQRGSNLATIQQGEIINSFRPIREDIVKTAYAAYIAELTDKLIDSKLQDPFVFPQFLQTISWISEGKDAEVLSIIYELKMFKKAGIAPVLDRCVRCKSEEGPFYFSINEGGLLCGQCRNVDPEAVLLKDNHVRLLQIFDKVDMERVGDISIKPENKRFLRQLIDAYYDRYGGYFIKSKKFLKQLDMLQ